MNATVHYPVLLKEVVQWVAPQEGVDSFRILDCTLGGGGHAEALLESYPAAKLFGIDRDAAAVARVRNRLARFGNRQVVVQGSFADLQHLFRDGALGEERFDRIMADLGTSMDQLKGARGFSFHDDASLDMRMDQSQPRTAAHIVNEYPLQDLIVMFKRGGSGNEAKGIARAIIAARPIVSAKQLAQVISDATPARFRGDTHPATVPFQALRIEVNDEFSQIHALLEAIPQLVVGASARSLVITFHSLEDTLVTKQMRRWEQGGEHSALSRVKPTEFPKGKLLTKKPVVPQQDEISKNPPSRSARLRVFEFSEEVFT